MSAIGPKQTLAFALHMFAFGGKADMTIALNGINPKRTSVRRSTGCFLTPTEAFPRVTLSRYDGLR
jgi:hypothetical protein